MMREIRGVAQDGSGVQRRWFHDDYFDLFVWHTDQGETTSFQLCYGADAQERALEWRKDQGWFLDGKSSAEAAEPIASRFEIASGELPDSIRKAVAARLREYAEQASVTARRSKVRRAAWQKDMPGSG
ncbi:MAG: hypothetical protein IH606_16245 [Burkholderiales bacterium]|nr:hypothetical protein [Burkholderiales bacterium]